MAVASYLSPILGKLEDQKMIDISWQSNLSVNLKPRGVRFVPTFVARLAWIGMKTTDTALLGHSGTVFLTASSLSDFWTSASGVFLNDTLLGSLCGQAYGAKNYDLVGIWLQVSLTVFSWVLIPVVIMWLSTAPILQMAVGTDVEVAKDAGCLILEVWYFWKLFWGMRSVNCLYQHSGFSIVYTYLYHTCTFMIILWYDLSTTRTVKRYH